MPSAFYENSHQGYQQWHRMIDKHMVSWLENHPFATVKEFWKELYKMYNNKDMIARFGEGILQYIRQEMHKGG